MSKRSKAYTHKVEIKENNWLLPVTIIVIGAIIGIIVIYSEQGQPATPQDNNQDIRDTLVAYAADVDLDIDQFNACLDEGKYTTIIEDDVKDGLSNKISATPSFFINGTLLSGALPASSFTEAIDAELAKDEKNTNAIGPGFASVKGNPEAEVMIVEFTDYDCPFCSRYVQETLPVIMEQYVETGLVKYAVRNFPLDQLHAHAREEAEASLCAHDQGKFWEYHDILFATTGTRPTSE